MTKNDFSMSMTDINGTFIKLEEINRMISLGVLKVDEKLLAEYRFNTQVQYDGDRNKIRKYWKHI